MRMFPALRSHAVLVAVTVLMAMPVGALQVAAQPSSKSESKSESRSDAKTSPRPPRVASDKSRALDTLFAALKAAPDDATARQVEARIWAVWAATPSDTASLLATRAKAAMEAQNYDVALSLLDVAVKLRPDYVEAWNRRATIHYLKNDYTRSLADIRQVLAREPRHFGALAGLGMIMQDIGDDKRALQAFRQALAIDPRMEKVPDLVKALAEKVEGRDI